MDQSLEREIRRLYSCFHSPEDRQGRSFVSLADAYRRAGDLLRARLLLEEGLRRHPDFSSAHVVAMRIARDVSDHAGALAATRRVLELDPDNEEARQVLARVGPLIEDAPASGLEAGGDAGLPDESWMAGDAGVWAAGTDSGLASVDPVALEAEEEQAGGAPEEDEAAAAETAEEPATTAEAEAERAAAGEAEERPPVAVQPGEGQAARVTEDAAEKSLRPARIPAGATADASGAVEDAGIYTRTMGRLYEQQGLHAQAIAVYERLIESEPDDEALASRLERLRGRALDEGSRSAFSAPEPRGDSPGIDSTGSEAPADDERSTTAGDRSANASEGTEATRRGGGTVTAPDVVLVPVDSLPVVPIEALAPDAPIPGAREEAP